MDIIESLAIILKKNLEHFTVKALSKKLGASNETIYKILKCDNVKLGKAIKWILLLDHAVDFKIYGETIRPSKNEVKNGFKDTVEEVKNIVRAIVNEKYTSMREASLSISEHHNYIWDALNRKGVSLDGLFNIIKNLREEVSVYVDNKKVTFSLGNIFEPDKKQ